MIPMTEQYAVSPSHVLVQAMPQRGATFRQDYAALRQHCVQLIGQPGPRCGQLRMPDDLRAVGVTVQGAEGQESRCHS
jgi:hypothetical protein